MRNQKNLSYFRRIIVSSVLLCFIINSKFTFAQISASNASFSGLTSYTSSANDPVYVFCDQLNIGVGELRADSPDGTSGWTFDWTRWQQGTGNFSQAVANETNLSSSIVTNLIDGRYRVIMSKNGETDVTSIAWVINNNGNGPGLVLDQMDCVGVHFTSSFTPKDLQYNDIDDIPNLKSVIPNIESKTINFLLLKASEEILTSTETLLIPPFNIVEKSFIDQEAFETEEGYEILLTDQYGCEFRSDPIVSGTYVVDALFTIDEPQGEAIHPVTITNTSVNATEYEWLLYQDFSRIDEGVISVEDSLLTDGILLKNDKTPFEYEYLHPGDYFIKLIAKSDKGPEVCIDELMLETPIVVDTSLVQVPNVFTPNGDGRNDVWRIKSKSLKSFHAIVFNRWGRVVYEWRNPDEGWNGKVNGKMATPGTYFYVITAVGREEDTKKYTKKGSFMLIRK